MKKLITTAILLGHLVISGQLIAQKASQSAIKLENNGQYEIEFNGIVLSDSILFDTNTQLPIGKLDTGLHFVEGRNRLRIAGKFYHSNSLLDKRILNYILNDTRFSKVDNLYINCIALGDTLSFKSSKMKTIKTLLVSEIREGGRVLDINGLDSLFMLNVLDSNFETLCVSESSNLIKLRIRDCKLKSLDLSGLKKLTRLYLSHNPLKSVNDILLTLPNGNCLELLEVSNYYTLSKSVAQKCPNLNYFFFIYDHSGKKKHRKKPEIKIIDMLNAKYCKTEKFRLTISLPAENCLFNYLLPDGKHFDIRQSH